MTEELPNLFRGRVMRLRAHEPEDWETFWDHGVDTESSRAAYRIPPPQSAAVARKWAEEQALKTEGDNRAYVIESSDGEVVGSLSTAQSDQRNGIFWYGIGIFAEHRRRGYASDAVRVLLRYYFGELGYQKAHGEVYAFNAPSLVMHEQHLVEEGRRRRTYRTGGRYFDEVLFGITAEEFAPHFE